MLVVLGVGVGLLGAPTAAAALPNWMAALGDSITLGYGSSGAAGSGDNPTASWSTGTNGSVSSHYSRLLALNPPISGHAASYAQDGVKMSSMQTQAQSAVSFGPDYVTIMAGTNDVCTQTVGQMTSVNNFKSQLTATLTTLTQSLPNAKILVTSIPNWYGLWQTFQSNPSALSAWSTYPTRCPDLLGSGATTADRQAVSQRIIDLNAGTAQVCAGYAACRYDNGAVYSLSFTSTDLTYDYFHPSITGQALLAATTWGAGPYALPTNTSLPVVSGLAQEGQTLGATTGTWSGNPSSYAYQWRRCDVNGANCADIGGATGTTYLVAGGDVGSRIRIDVTATNANGSTTAASATTQVVTPPPPTNTDLPAVSGVVQEGRTLDATTGNWTGSPTSFGYQWRRCASDGGGCTNIVGATASSYQLTSGEVNSTIRVVVTASNAGGASSATSDPTGVVAEAPPANTSPPTISGLTQAGLTLTANPGSWTDTPTFSYQWLRCDGNGDNCSPVGADASTYNLSAGDIGSRMRVEVTGINGGGATSATSEATAVVTEALPANTAAPVVSGTAQEGETLTSTTGGWTNSPSSFSYQWRRCNQSGGGCLNIAGATDSSYELVSDDVDSTIRARVTATNDGGSGSADSNPTAIVTALPPVSGDAPTVSGSAQEGQTLTADPGTWSGNPTYAYQWLRCDGAGGNCTPVGAGSTSYDLTGPDVGSTIRVEVTATNSGGSASATSDATALVTEAAPQNTTPPGVSGTAQEGNTLTADPGSWTDTPTYTYQWLRCNSAGTGCSPIGGETTTGYQLTSTDIDSTIRVEVTATNNGGTATADSAATAVVTALPPTNDTPPTITGTAEENHTLNATTGTWTGHNPTYTYQWQRCDTGGGNCTPVGTGSTSYDLTGPDVGSTIRVAVTATNSGGPATATSDPTAIVAQSPPTNTALPTISGPAQEGQTLTAAPGTWTGNPTYTQQWLRCDTGGDNCTLINGQTTTSYQLAAADVDHTIRVEVTGTNATGSATADSNPTAVVTEAAPVNSGPPSISGTAQEGQTLTADPGSWTDTPTYAFQWQRCNGGSCTPVGANSPSYDLTGNDVGSTIQVEVTATNAGGSASATSNPTGVVIALPPVNSALPAIAGTPQEGQTLTADPGTWSGNPTYAYQWLRCDGAGGNCTPVGAGSTSYDLTGPDVGSTIRVEVTATNSGGSASATSDATGPVTEAAPQNTTPPGVSGTAQEGNTLTADPGSWTDTPTYTYQWLRCNSAGTGCSPIGGETTTGYQLTSTDIDSTIRVEVTATNNGGAATADSAATAVVIALPPTNDTPPTITGTAEENHTLNATTGTWTGHNPTYTYQWQRCDTGGGNCTPVGTGSTSYDLTGPDVGSTIRVAVTATNSGGPATATSDPTAIVAQSPPTNTALPTISGPAQEGQTLTAAPGTWTGNPTYTQQWLRCDTGGDNCTLINGQTTTSYQLAAADVDHTIRVEVTGTNATGSATADSNPTAVVEDPPINIALPAISGGAHEGQTLTATTGDWTGSPTGFAYRWLRCDGAGGSCTPIGGTTASAYQLGAIDIDHTIRVEVTASTSGGSTPATSDPTDVVTAAAFAPSIASFSGGTGVPGTTVKITGSRLYKASSVQFNGVEATITYNIATTVKAIVPNGATSGPISITTQDGTDTSTAAFVVKSAAKPKVTSLRPTSGVPGTIVKISGSALLGATVEFNGAEATITKDVANQIQAIVPPSATTGPITVTTSGGTATSSSFTVQPSPAPKINGFPGSGYVGKIVKISGSGLLAASAVTFNGVAAAITSNTSGAIKAIVPSGATTGPISVTTPGGTATSSSNFTVKASPTAKLTSFNPTSGVPGTQVTISGSGLLGTSSVKFGGVEAEFDIVSATSIKALVPPGAPTGVVSITAPSGSVVSTTEFTVL